MARKLLRTRAGMWYRARSKMRARPSALGCKTHARTGLEARTHAHTLTRAPAHGGRAEAGPYDPR